MISVTANLLPFVMSLMAMSSLVTFASFITDKLVFFWKNVQNMENGILSTGALTEEY